MFVLAGTTTGRPHLIQAELRKINAYLDTPASWLESGFVYGYRKVTDDLRALGETCGQHRVYRLMSKEKLRSQTGYHRRPGKRGGNVTDFASNHLKQQFKVAESNRVWVNRHHLHPYS